MPPHSPVDVGILQVAIEEHAKAAGPEPPFYQLRLRQLEPVLRQAVEVEPNPLLIGRTLYERVWVVINRAVRRVIRHGVEPGVRAQNDRNRQVMRVLDRLIAADAALHAEVIRLHAERKHGGV